MDKKGKTVIPPQFRLAKSFSEGLAAVMNDQKWGYIDKKGKVVIERAFTLANSFSEGLAGVMIGQKWGYIDKTGKVAVKADFNWAENFSGGLALVQKGLKWGFIDKKGAVAIPLKFDFALSFSEGLAGVEVNGKWGFVDRTGKMVIPPNFHDAESFSEGLAIVSDGKGGLYKPKYPKYRKHARKYGYINKKGELAIPMKFYHAQPFSEGLAVARTEEGIALLKGPHGRLGQNRSGRTISYINKSGNIHFTLITIKNVPNAKDFSGGFSYVNAGQHSGNWYVTQKGEAVQWGNKEGLFWRGGPKEVGMHRLRIIWPDKDKKKAVENK